MNTFNFLPEDYEAPKSGGLYMKLQKGENKIRILSKPILGWEDWIDNKPVRSVNKPEKSNDPQKPAKHFWAMVVWNYSEEKIQILQVSQSGVQKGIESLSKDSDWGNPGKYDIKIIKTGEDKQTKYQVNPLPHKPIAAHIVKSYQERPCYLEALFVNEDPFSSHWPKKTPSIFNDENMAVKEEIKPKSNSDVITKDQVDELGRILMSCDPTYMQSVFDTLKKAPLNISNLKDLPVPYYEKVKTAALKKRDEFQNKPVPEFNLAMA